MRNQKALPTWALGQCLANLPAVVTVVTRLWPASQSPAQAARATPPTRLLARTARRAHAQAEPVSELPGSDVKIARTASTRAVQYRATTRAGRASLRGLGRTASVREGTLGPLNDGRYEGGHRSGSTKCPQPVIGELLVISHTPAAQRPESNDTPIAAPRCRCSLRTPGPSIPAEFLPIGLVDRGQTTHRPRNRFDHATRDIQPLRTRRSNRTSNEAQHRAGRPFRASLHRPRLSSWLQHAVTRRPHAKRRRYALRLLAPCLGASQLRFRSSRGGRPAEAQAAWLLQIGSLCRRVRNDKRAPVKPGSANSTPLSLSN